MPEISESSFTINFGVVKWGGANCLNKTGGNWGRVLISDYRDPPNSSVARPDESLPDKWQAGVRTGASSDYYLIRVKKLLGDKTGNWSSLLLTQLFIIICYLPRPPLPPLWLSMACIVFCLPIAQL